jgi:5-methyltetrahydropteroyltriglutamate--homocysteine methyltransferase
VLSRLGDKAVVVGVIDLGTPTVETEETVIARITNALKYLPPERLIVAPDCGMKYLPRRSAFEKLDVMVRAANSVRTHL